MLKETPNSFGLQTSLAFAAVLRVTMGLVFFLTAMENSAKGLYGPGFRTFVAGLANGNPLPWYRSFLEGVVLPNWQAVALLQAVAEYGMGIALLIGLFTPLASLGGVFFFLNLLLASWQREWPWTYGNMIVMLLVAGASGSGRWLGLDYLLAKRAPWLNGLVAGLHRLPGKRPLHDNLS
ncbi:MAG: DoxX family protein [Chloroflexota bacterium]